MRYWWVNQNQTFRQEFSGEYIWSPKRRKDGARNRFYEFLREVVPGDVVFSYAHGIIQGAGFAVSYCYTCPRPAEFGHIGELWDIVGWRVDVRFRPFGQPIRPKAHLHLLEPLLEHEEYAPLRLSDDGHLKGQQHIYLTSISTALAQVLLGLLGSDGLVFQPTTSRDSGDAQVERQLVGQQEWEDNEQRRILAAEEITTTTRTALVKARVGQGLFKERVFYHEQACRLTQVTNPTHLVGSHIKPWRESTNEERLEGANGLLLTPTADHLFDRGFITFDDNGEVVIAKVADRVSLKRMGLDPDSPPLPRPFNVDQRHFLAHHRREIFLGA